VGGGGRARVRLAAAGGAEAVTSATPWADGEHVIVLTPELRRTFSVGPEAASLSLEVDPEPASAPAAAPSGKRPSGMRKKR
jgi:hypothetical protein